MALRAIVTDQKNKILRGKAKRVGRIDDSVRRLIDDLVETMRAAPVFSGLYIALIVFGALPLLVPGAPLLPIIFLSQVVAVMLIPIVIIFMLLLVNDRSLMGAMTSPAIATSVTKPGLPVPSTMRPPVRMKSSTVRTLGDRQMAACLVGRGFSMRLGG